MSSQIPTISFKDVSKTFNMQKQKTFKEFLPALIGKQQTHSKFTVFKNLSFDIYQGETVGITGPNGSGKSTILKLIAGVTTQDTGTIVVKGKVSPLIELGSGMHPELTGRENVFLNGAILGLSQKQITNKFKDIIDFAELWEFIDEPVKHYSSGMFMRLAFSVAVHVDPDILLIDEILAVGDVNFQTKCYKKMEEFKEKGVTMVLVSHSQEVINRFCSKTIKLTTNV